MFLFFVLTALLIALAMGMSYWLAAFVAEGKVLRLVRGLLLLFDGGMIAAIFIGPKYLRDISFAVEVVMFFAVLIVVQFIFCVLVGLALLLRRARKLVVDDVPFDGGRRKLLQHAAVYPAAAFGMGLYGNLWERNQTVVNRYEIPAGVPGNLSGFTLAQISDVHIGMFYSLEMLQALLRKAAELKPDALVITGDIFDHVKMNPEAIRLVDRFVDAFPRGIWYCHGNHEHRRGIGPIEEMLRETRLHVLVNAAEPVVDGQKLYIVGADYPMHRQEEVFQQEKAAYLKTAMQAVPEDAVCVLLAHHPEFIDDAREYGIPLTLTGHTHGSQFGIFGVPLFPIFKYTRGMVQKDGCYGYVHVGNGSWFPYRFGCPPEIALFTLKGKAV